MTRYVGLLRAVNVGGTGKLAMGDLRAICEACGFRDVATYIQSGNVLFMSALAEADVKAALEKALARKLGKPTGAIVRTAAQLEDALRRNPFPDADPARVLVLFLDVAVVKGALARVEAPGRERVVASGREVFVHYPDGMGRSKLKLPLAKVGTGRNVNTVTKLVALAQASKQAP